MHRLLIVSSVVIGLAACSERPAPTAPTAVSHSSVAISADARSNAPASTTASTAAPNEAAARYEQKFMTGMIDHHQMAIEMAEMCLSRAVHDELRQLCQNIIAAQSAEIRQLQDWLKNWYGVAYSPMMSKAAARDMMHLGGLTGAEFEIAFMDMMIEHHEGAVEEGRRCIERAYHKPLVELCHDIIATQTAEIEQMRTWLCQWYQRC